MGLSPSSLLDEHGSNYIRDENEKFAPPIIGMPGQFPVYLRLPYRRDYYFCFRQDARQAEFLSILSDCIRHQNQGPVRTKARAVLQFSTIHSEAIGTQPSSDILVKTEKHHTFLPTPQSILIVILIQSHLKVVYSWLSAQTLAHKLNQQYKIGFNYLFTKYLTNHTELHIMTSYLDYKLPNDCICPTVASVLESAEKFCSESVQPYLASVLEELMGPISSGFQEARLLSDSQMDQLCQDFQEGGVTNELKQALAKLSRPNLLSCYQRINSLHDQLHDLQERFGFSNISSLVHSTQIDLQQVNITHTLSD
ncbi:unnamed protein product [Oncorhynchus mykiss]|uniref:Niban 1/2/3 domain-containing protein n=1 Tax=Oncorhynchus mykiss TaxID=8022 RepID=A0A060WC98_ONCMY|nr:unnamed protein product [Oncorhynchus mykiss]